MKILITAGPTWVALDKARVISNTASGATGILLAEKLARCGIKVTLLLGPGEYPCLNPQIRLVRFRFFADLREKVARELKDKSYNAVIHSAAVSDYQPLRIYSRKIRSGLKKWRLELVPTTKIIDSIKRTNRSLFLVGFKFEPAAGKRTLILKAKRLMKESSCDLVVANAIDHNRYRAYIINKNKTSGPFKSKRNLAEGLTRLLIKAFN